MKCEYCKKEIIKYPSRKRKFCSLSCSAKSRIESNTLGFQKGHKMRVGMKHPDSFLIARKGEGNPGWKGNNITKGSIHCWVRDNFEKERKCEHCGTTEAKVYDWSHKTHIYTRNREEWQKLCRSCHQKYDYKVGLRVKNGTKKNI